MIPEGIEVTRLLRRAESGDAEASHALVTALYEELHGLAQRAMGGRAEPVTLQPTALVHEAWIKLFGGEPNGRWKDRRHFVNAAAKAMRHVLIDHARARQTDKRGGGRRTERLDACVELMEESGPDLLILDDALVQLAAVDPELVQLVELRFFAGLSIAETARVLEVSDSSVERSWRVARAWLRSRLQED